MSNASHRPTESTPKKSFAYEQYQRSQRIYGLVGSPDYPTLGSADTAVLLALNFHSKLEGDGMRPSTATLALMTNLSRRTIVRALSRLLSCGLLTMEAKKHKRAVVSYRFGTRLLSESCKLRDLLEAKLGFRNMQDALRPMSQATSATETQRREDRSATQSSDLRRVVHPVGSPCQTASATQTVGSDRVSHRTNSEQVEEPIEEQTREPSRTHLGASHPLNGASPRFEHSERGTYGRHCYTHLEFDPSELNTEALVEFLGRTE